MCDFITKVKQNNKVTLETLPIGAYFVYKKRYRFSICGCTS